MNNNNYDSRQEQQTYFLLIDKVGLKVSQFIGVRSFVQRSEYFKGVPIYIVQVPESPRNLFVETLFYILLALSIVFGQKCSTAN